MNECESCGTGKVMPDKVRVQSVSFSSICRVLISSLRFFRAGRWAEKNTRGHWNIWALKIQFSKWTDKILSELLQNTTEESVFPSDPEARWRWRWNEEKIEPLWTQVRQFWLIHDHGNSDKRDSVLADCRSAAGSTETSDWPRDVRFQQAITQSPGKV